MYVCMYVRTFVRTYVCMCIYIYIPRGPSVLILRTGSYFSSVNFKNGFYYFLALAIILEISLDLWVISIYLSTYRSIMHSSACGSTGCVDTTLIYYVDLLDVWTYWKDIYIYIYIYIDIQYISINMRAILLSLPMVSADRRFAGK